MIIHCPTILMDNRGSRSDLFIYSRVQDPGLNE